VATLDTAVIIHTGFSVICLIQINISTSVSLVLVKICNKTSHFLAVILCTSTGFFPDVVLNCLFYTLLTRNVFESTQAFPERLKNAKLSFRKQ